MRQTCCILLASLTLGCTGTIYDAGERDDPHQRPGIDDPPPVDPRVIGDCAEGATPGRLYRLSHSQFEASVSAAFGDLGPLTAGFEPEASGTGFENGADVSYVSTRQAEAYMQAAETVAEAVADNLASLSPEAAPDPEDRADVARWVDALGTRLFRKPMTDAQRDRYMALYDDPAARDGSDGIYMIVAAMLQSPHFLYRFELGEEAAPGTVVPLTSYEMATQLAYLLWDAPPDDALRERAARDDLTSPDAIEEEVDRLLADPRARDFVWGFFDQYLGLRQVPNLDKDPERFPAWSPALAESLVDEARTLVDDVVWEGDGTLRTLFTADYTFVDGELAALYGVSGVDGSELVRVDLDPSERAGLLTHAGFLATLGDHDSSSPTFRGHFVRTQLLCQNVPDPPPDVADMVEPPDDVQTTRERYAAHVEREACFECHRLLDPIGFGFEEYDAIGRFRTTENGAPVDASGSIEATREIDGDFRGARELAELLASTTEVSDCVAMHFFRYALGRLELEADACELERIRAAFADSDTSIYELIRVVLTSSSMRNRIRLEGE